VILATVTRTQTLYDHAAAFWVGRPIPASHLDTQKGYVCHWTSNVERKSMISLIGVLCDFFVFNKQSCTAILRLHAPYSVLRVVAHYDDGVVQLIDYQIAGNVVISA